MLDPAWGTRFYGMAVPRDVAAAVDEGLTDRSITDLVDAHLAINYSYFGAIDKTLAGFVILDSTGDDYTLYDLRDGNQVWWQDHETREVSLRHDKLGSTAQAKTPRAERVPSTPALDERYQWLVWILARPLIHDGAATQSPDELVRGGIGRFRRIWPDRAHHDAAFEVELPRLAKDPHLAIYWLLHTTMLSDDAGRARVVEAIGRGGPELVRAFVDRFGALPRAGDLPVVPEFRVRRALALTYGAFELEADVVPAACLAALETSPSTQSLVHALQVVAGIDRGVLDAALVQQTLARIPDVTTGTELVRAVLDKRAGLAATKRADALARLVAASDDPWYHALEALWLVHELAYDGVALVAATRRIVAGDRYHRRALQMAMRAAQIAGEPIDTIETDLAIADGVLEPFKKLTDAPADWQTTVHALSGFVILRRALAWRVLQRVELNKPSPALAAWAATEVLAGGDTAAQQLVGVALAGLSADAVADVVDAAKNAIDRPDHPSVGVLFALLDGPAADRKDRALRIHVERAKEAAVIALAPWAHDPAVFARLMAIVERPGAGDAVGRIWNKLFNPFAKGTYIVPRLDATQAVRAARAMIATCLSHPDIQARNTASHQLYRFSHPAAEPFLIDALTEYAVRFAAARTDGDRLEDVVDNLYAAVRGLGTPAAHTALIERLFAERRAYWRMGNAIGDIWSPSLHARIMTLLGERRDARAAGCYAYALVEFVKHDEPLVELAALVTDWQGETEQARRFLHYALVVGINAALDAGDLDLVRRAHEAAAWIAEPPLEPDDAARGRGWDNPLDEPAVKARLERVLAGLSVAPPPPPSRPPKKPARAPAARAKPAAKAKAKPKPAVKAKAKAKVAAKPKAKAKAAAKPKAKAKAAAKPKAKAKAKPKRRN